MYTTEMKEAEISVEEYVSKYVRPEEFLQYCRECPNYGHKWSCPEYDFDTREYFRRYRNLKVFGLKILYDEDLCRKELTREEMRKILSESMMVERKKLDSVLRELEEKTGGTGLNAGACALCAECTRDANEGCRFPEKMRYSLESLGGDITATIKDLLGIDLIWDSNGHLPAYYTLVAGLLYN